MHPVDAFIVSDSDEVAWELFHENSKTSRVQPHPFFGRHPRDHEVVAMMKHLREVKPHRDREHIPLPSDVPPLRGSLEEALLTRESARAFTPAQVPVERLATVLHCAYGVTRRAPVGPGGEAFPRDFRAVPSGGALYPLELYVLARSVTSLAPGLYHYDPHEHELDVLGAIDLSGTWVQPDLAETAAWTLLVAAVFVRSVAKYGDRGYRFVLLEAGHVAQNAVLAARGCGLSSVPVGGFFDRDLDAVLGLDGLNESVVYAVHVGTPGPS